MSRISAQATFKSQPVAIVVGWDRRLQACFMQVNLTPAQEKNRAFKSLATISMRLVGCSIDLEDVEMIAANEQIEIPEPVLRELRSHVNTNAGNKVVEFDAAGNCKVLVEA